MQPGKDYLEPEISLIVDDIIETNERNKLKNYIDKWLKEKINFILKSLIDLRNLEETNSLNVFGNGKTSQVILF